MGWTRFSFYSLVYHILLYSRVRALLSVSAVAGFIYFGLDIPATVAEESFATNYLFSPYCLYFQLLQ